MQVQFVTVKYMHCHISLYSKATSEISSNKTKITSFSFYFLLKQHFVENSVKEELEFLYFLRTNSLLFVSVTVPNKSQ